MPSTITFTASGVERSRSVSSTRRMNCPFMRRAYSQLNSAVRTPPMWSMPVGLGANRVTTFVEFCMARMVAAFRRPMWTRSLHEHDQIADHAEAMIPLELVGRPAGNDPGRHVLGAMIGEGFLLRVDH